MKYCLIIMLLLFASCSPSRRSIYLCPPNFNKPQKIKYNPYKSSIALKNKGWKCNP